MRSFITLVFAGLVCLALSATPAQAQYVRSGWGISVGPVTYWRGSTGYYGRGYYPHYGARSYYHRGYWGGPRYYSSYYGSPRYYSSYYGSPRYYSSYYGRPRYHSYYRGW